MRWLAKIFLRRSSGAAEKRALLLPDNYLQKLVGVNETRHRAGIQMAFPGQRILVDYSPGGCKESDMTERLTETQPLN